MICTQCSEPLTGRQTKYCSQQCKYKSANIKHQNYTKQQERGRTRKLDAINRFGGKCQKCGYNKNWAVLSFHHTKEKVIGLDLRAFSNYSETTLNLELEKCELLCMNCHTEYHHPECSIVPG